MNRIRHLRENNPLVVCITNDVVKNFTANGMLAVGASPIMSGEKSEAADLMKVASGLLINIGTADEMKKDLMEKMICEANENSVPVVFDPVGYGASEFRSTLTDTFINTYSIDLIKGNAGEMLALSGAESELKGVDSSEKTDTLEIAEAVYNKFQVPVLVTGERDALVSSDKKIAMTNGHGLQGKITGSGCLIGAMAAAFIGVEHQFNTESVVDAVSFYNLCAEAAAESTRIPAPGTFTVNLIDQLYLNENDILSDKRVEAF